jgi:hypothetical protein
MANLINEAEIRATWAPIIESATGINDANKLAWMSEYCHNHKLYEEATLSSVTPVMLKGMGAASLPNMAASFDDQMGSGDKAPTLLPLAMQVAAQTVGLDLVPVVPMAGPMGLLSYLDFVYDGGSQDNPVLRGAQTNVLYVKSDNPAAIEVGDFVYVSDSRIDELPIFSYSVALDGTQSLQAIWTADGGLGNLSTVAALEDHIAAFSGDANGNPFSRAEGERTPEQIMGLSLFSKSVAAETFQVAAAVTREQVQDLKQFGVDAVAQVESVLTNELTQSINKLIISKMNAIAGEHLLGAGNTLDLGGALSGGNTYADVNRRILTNILAAANLIANQGRRGAGNFAVVDWKVASALQAVAGFVPNPMANTFSQVAGAIYPLGAVAGVNVYVDPNQVAGTTQSILVGRKGDGNGSGLVFMPYLMAESVQTIAEGTMAPKIAVKSRFALVEAGFHPELNYEKFAIENLAL